MLSRRRTPCCSLRPAGPGARVRRALTHLLLLLALGCAGLEAAAERGPGLRAPPVEGRAPPGVAGASEAELVGRFTLLEFFRVGCPHCRKAAPLVNRLRARFLPQGLHVLAVAYEGPDEVQRFVREVGLEVPVLAASLDALRDYGVPSLPRAYLVNPAGRIDWSGSPASLSEEALAALLARAPALPSLSRLEGPLRPAADALGAGRYGEADRLLAAALAGAGSAPLGEAVARTAEAARRFLAWHGPALEAAAQADVAAARCYDAWLTRARLATAYAGLPLAERAAAAAAALEADVRCGPEVRGGRALHEARLVARGLAPAAALPLFQRVEQEHPGTAAAARAAQHVADLRKASQGLR